MTFKMKGFPMHESAALKQKKHPLASPKYSKSHIESIEYINDAEDELEFLNEDLFNDRITKAHYDAKKKVLDMKIEAGKKAIKN